MFLVALCACRAASPTGDETPLHQARVYNGSPLPRSSGTFTSTAADLAPIAESIRSTIRFDADLTGSGLAWDFQGSTEDYDPLILGAGSHVGPIDHGPRVPVVIASYAALQAELDALTMDPGLAMLLGAATLPPLPTSNLTDGIQLGLRFDLTDVRWLPPALGGGPGATLAVGVPLDVRIALDELLSPLFDVATLRTTVTTPIDVTPCGACTDPSTSCVDAPTVLASGYRVPAISTALGYAPTDVDATYPAMGLNVIARVPAAGDPGLSGVSGRAVFNAACPFVFADTFSPTFLDIFNLPADDPGLAALLLLVEFGRSVAGIFKYVAGIVACQIVANTISDQLHSAVSPIPASLGPAFRLLVNPPAFTRSRIGIPIPLVPAGTDTVLERAIARIELEGGPAGGASRVLTGPDGGYTDDLFNTIALGGSASVAATLDLTPVNEACEAGVGLNRLDRLTICRLCAPGGACAAGLGGCGFVCAGDGTFSSNATVPAGFGGVPAAVTIAPAPTVATLLSVAPQFAETLRRWFSSPLPPGARYSAATAGVGSSATFSYVIDPDQDCIVVDDGCPDAFDPGQEDDGDGDLYGAACDRCPGVAGSSADANEDTDGDGTANGCDCDIDGDGCNNPIPGMLAGCPPGPDGINDRSPRSRSGRDFDADGIPDDCDNDRDNDGVLDLPTDGSRADNCPLGNGDTLYEPGTDADQDPDQTDSGGLADGDICDPLCPGPGAPGCDVPFAGGGPGAAGFGPGSGGRFAGFPGLGACAGLPGGLCDLRALLLCDGADIDLCWRPDEFSAVQLVDSFGQLLGQIDAAQLGLDGGFSGQTTTIPDLDSDGLDEIVVSAPRAELCPQGFECVGATGVLLIIGSKDGALLGHLPGHDVGSLFGASLARLGHVLAVGSPGSSEGAGSVSMFSVSAEGVQLLRVLHGERAGDRMGADVAPAFGVDTAAPSFIIGAPGARGGAGHIVVANASQGITHRYEGPVPGGAMSRGVVVGTASDFTVVAGIPAAESGRGRVVFFTGRGAPRMRRGGVGARLGESLVVVDGVEVVAAAPGARSIVRYSSRAEVIATLSSDLPLFGEALASPGDLNGDGTDDILVGFGEDASGMNMASVAFMRNPP